MQYVLTEQELQEIKGNPERHIAEAIAKHKEEFKVAILEFSHACSDAVKAARNNPFYEPEQPMKRAAERFMERLDLGKLWMP